MNKILKKIIFISLLLFSKTNSMELQQLQQNVDYLSLFPKDILIEEIFPNLINWHIDDPKLMLKNLIRLEQTSKKIRQIIKKSEFKIPDIFFKITDRKKINSYEKISYEKLKNSVFELLFQDIYFEQRLWGTNKIQRQYPLKASFLKSAPIEKLRPYSHAPYFLNLVKESTKKVFDQPLPINNKNETLEVCAKLNKEYLKFPENFFYSNLKLLKSISVKNKHSLIRLIIEERLPCEKKDLLIRTTIFCLTITTVFTILHCMVKKETSLNDFGKLILNFLIFSSLHLLVENYDTPTNKIIISELVMFGLIYFLMNNIF